MVMVMLVAITVISIALVVVAMAISAVTYCGSSGGISVLLAVELSGMVTVIVSENGMAVMVSDGIVVGGKSGAGGYSILV